MTLFRRTRTTAALAAAAVVATGLLTAAQAAEPTSTVTIRQGDLIPALGDTRSAGHVTFLADGLGVVTDDSSSQAKAAEYFPISGALPDSASIDWYGTQPQPGIQIVFDVDGTTGNGNDYNILVGEPTYYGDNWWLTERLLAGGEGSRPLRATTTAATARSGSARSPSGRPRFPTHASRPAASASAPASRAVA